MRNSTLKGQTLGGVIWNSIERFSVIGVQFLVMLVIARLIEPKDFGLVGMLAIFIAISQTVVDSGMPQALIRKTNRTFVDTSTVFFFNIAISFVLYGILWGIAPFVSDFYNEPLLTSLMRVLCFVIIINSFAVVQRTLFTASIDFKTQAKISLIAAVVSGVISIFLAIEGAGAWALVWQQLVNSFVSAILLWTYSSWRPKFVYSWNSFWDFFSYGSKLLASGLLETIYRNLYSLIIGKYFSASNLGQYTQAKNYTQLPSATVSSVLSKVIFPVLCNIQGENERLKDIYRRMLRLSCFIIFPLMCGLASLSHPVVEVTIGNKWSFAADIILPLCFSGMWYPVHALNLDLLQVKGRSDLFLRIEIIKKIIGTLTLFLSIPYGVMFMCYVSILTSIVSLFINTYYTGKLINVDFITQMKDVMGSLSVSFAMFIFIYSLTLIMDNNIIKIIVGIISGAVFYLLSAYIFNFKELDYLKDIVK